MSTLITLQIEGVPSEGGHIPVSDFIARIEHLLSVLNGIDRMVGQTAQPTLYYRIVDASHSSPIRLTVEPVIRKRVVKPEKRHIEIRHERFFKELNAIHLGEPVSAEVDDLTLGHIRELVEGVGKEFAAARISNGDTEIALDAKFEKNVRRLLDEEDASYGSEEGMLEALNVHGQTRKCWIYPRIGPQRICCDFLPGTKDQILESVGKYVRVEGVKFFRPNSPFPFRVAVREFEVLADETDTVYIKNIGGIAPDATGELSSVEFIRKLRDEWD